MPNTITSKNITPLPGYVLVQPAETEKKTASGIYLPETHEEKPQYGTVLACGDTAMIDGVEVDCPVEADDMVIYKQWGGSEFKVGDTEYQFLKFEDILAVVTE